MTKIYSTPAVALSATSITSPDDSSAPSPRVAALLQLARYALSHSHSRQWLSAIAILLRPGEVGDA
jgi:hypothetical protein